MSFISKLGKSISGSKPKKTRALFLTPPYVNTTLVNGSLRRLCLLPKYVDLNEWLAVNAFDFFNHVNSFYGAIAEFCTQRECPVMCAGNVTEYTYTDSSKRTLKLSAPQYVDYVTTWIQNTLNDENVFPIKAGLEFPKDFLTTIRHLFKQLFRVFAHIYHNHYDKILHLSSEGHLNTLFIHFVCFAREFDLVEKKEMSVMGDLIEAFEAKGLLK